MSKKLAARVVLTMARPHGASPLDGTCLHGWKRSDKHMEFDYPNIMLELYFACEPIITISYLGKEDTEKDSNGPVRMSVCFYTRKKQYCPII